MKTRISFILALILSVPAVAQQSYSLQEAQDFAVQNAYNVRTNALEYEKAKKLYSENVARGLPQIYASADWTKNISLQAFVVDQGQGPVPLTFGTPYQANGTITGEQLIFDGSYVVALLAGKVIKENALNDWEKSEIDIREEVARAYHLVLVSQRTLEIVRENLVFIEKNYNESKKMFEAGFMEESDVDQFELIKSNLQNNINYLEKQKDIAMMLLKFQMGLDIQSTISLTDDIDKLMLFFAGW